jgi:hypothetical protein
MGYGIVCGDKTSKRAHRAVWELIHGSIPSGLCVCHRCDCRACVNPSHLFLGTNADNVTDMHRKWRHSHGETHHKAHLTTDQVREIRCSTDMGVTLARRFGVTPQSIRDVRRRKNWKHVP